MNTVLDGEVAESGNRAEYRGSEERYSNGVRKHFQTLEVKVSMVSLKWGDALSTLLPGALALLAISSWLPSLADLFKNMASVGVAEGFALLIAAALLGGVLEALTRISWEKFLVWKHPPCDALSRLSNENLPLYERGVQSSYKYVTFYANSAWAVILLLSAKLHDDFKFYWPLALLLLVIVMILFRASYVQWVYYVNYQKKVFGREDAQK
jgi:hypothetical protein